MSMKDKWSKAFINGCAILLLLVRIPQTVSASNTIHDTGPSDIIIQAEAINVIPTSGLTTSENGSSAFFTISLGVEPTSDVSISITSSDTGEGTVSTSNVTLNASNYSSGVTVTITGQDDPVVDGDIGYTIITGVAVSDDINYAGVDPADVSVTNSDNDIAGIVVSPTSGLVTTESGGTATFNIKLSSQPIADVTIGLTSSDPTEGTVLPASAVLTTTNWSSGITVTVTGVDDSIVDGNVAYSIITAAATSSDGNYNGTNPTDVGVTNNDNDVAGIVVNPTSGLVTTENGGTATFNIKLSSQPTANVSIALSSSDTSEGMVSPASAVLTTANWSTGITVTITGVNDLIADGNIVYSIITAAAVSLDSSYNGINPTDVGVTNTDNDTVGIIVNPTSGLVTTESGGTATFNIRLTSEPTANVTIGLSGDTTEGTLSPTSAELTSANWQTGITITVTGVDDSEPDGNIAYSIVTAAASSTDGNYAGINPSDVSVLNIDNHILVTPTSGLVTTEAGGTAFFTIALGSQPTANVTVGLSSSDLSEGTVSPISVVLTPDNWSSGVNVTVTGVDDFIADGNVLYTIVTAESTSSDIYFAGFNPPDVSVTNNNDGDTAGITVTPTSGLTTSETGSTATFTITLTSQPTGNVRIGLTSSDTGEGTVSPVSAVLTTANWSTGVIVTVTGVDDAIADGPQQYSIITAAASSGDSSYAGMNPSDVIVTNTDNDSPGYTVDPTAGLITSENGTTASFTVALTVIPASDVIINVLSLNTKEGIIQTPVGGMLTFTPENWSTPQMVVVKGVDDGNNPLYDNDGTIPYTIQLTVAGDPIYSLIDPPDVAASNTDNDPPPPANWVSPVSNEQIFQVTYGTVNLEAMPISGADFDHLWYARWDHVNNKWVDIGISSTAPYTVTLQVTSLIMGINQIYVYVFDKAGYRSPAPNNRIFLYRGIYYSTHLYMPVIRK